MYKNWTEYRASLDDAMVNLRKATPEVAKAFGSVVKAAGHPGTPEHTEQELLAIALSVAARCDGCIAIHAKALAEADVERERVVRALEMAVVFGGGPSFTYAAIALEAFDHFSGLGD